MHIARLGFLAAALLAAPVAAQAQTKVGEVSTTFRVIGPNDKIVVERYDDPGVANVACYVSRAETGGVTGWVGLATDPSRFSIACRGVGPVVVPPGIPAQEDVFRASSSPLFKALTVTRMWDAQRRVLVYLVVSTKLINGSPFNSVSAVPADPAR